MKKIAVIILALLLGCTVAAGALEEQDAYWTSSGREALWNALNTGSPEPLSAEEKSAFFARYAADMALAEWEAAEGISGSFSIRADGTFRADYRVSFEGETEEAAGSGSFSNVYQLSDHVYALETGIIQWETEDYDFLIQDKMLFEIPGATENDEGILIYELQNIAEQNGLDPAEPVPYCFITAFDSAPLWYGKIKDTGAAEPTDEWTCPECGQDGNSGNFCINCGIERQADQWTCPACGQNGNDGNFCTNCGAAKPAGEWDCPDCGQKGNNGNFCTNCGKPREN